MTQSMNPKEILRHITIKSITKTETLLITRKYHYVMKGIFLFYILSLFTDTKACIKYRDSSFLIVIDVSVTYYHFSQSVQ